MDRFSLSDRVLLLRRASWWLGGVSTGDSLASPLWFNSHTSRRTAGTRNSAFSVTA